jgi:6-phosphogluconate dehydrogenase
MAPCHYFLRKGVSGGNAFAKFGGALIPGKKKSANLTTITIITSKNTSDQPQHNNNK